MQRYSKLVAHVQQEGILQLLFLLRLGRLLLQMLLYVRHLCLVSAHAKVVGNISFLIGYWHHAEVQIYVATVVVSKLCV